MLDKDAERCSASLPDDAPTIAQVRAEHCVRTQQGSPCVPYARSPSMRTSIAPAIKWLIR